MFGKNFQKAEKAVRKLEATIEQQRKTIAAVEAEYPNPTPEEAAILQQIRETFQANEKQAQAQRAQLVGIVRTMGNQHINRHKSRYKRHRGH